jgi:hypothetical protein
MDEHSARCVFRQLPLLAAASIDCVCAGGLLQLDEHSARCVFRQLPLLAAASIDCVCAGGLLQLDEREAAGPVRGNADIRRP